MLYEDNTGTFKGFCSDSGSIEVLKKISTAGASNEYSYVCNDNERNWAISNPLRSKGYWCIDSSGNEPQIVGAQLINQVSCSAPNSTTTVNKNLAAMRDLLKDEFVNGCVDGSTPKSYCVCVFDKMEEGLGLDGMLDVFKKYNETNIMDEKTINLIRPCSN